MNVATKKPEAVQEVRILPLRMAKMEYHITGTAPLMIAKFAAKTQLRIEAAQEAGSAAKSSKKRDARNFEADAQAARHIFYDAAGEEHDGISASAFRNGMIDACRAAGFVMTKAKLGIFCEPDGFDHEDGMPLVKIIPVGKGDKPGRTWTLTKLPVRNANKSMDIRARPMWKEWKMVVKLRFDLDIFSGEDVANLLRRVGEQVGIGEGRPFGSTGAGMGMGLFTITQIGTYKEVATK